MYLFIIKSQSFQVSTEKELSDFIKRKDSKDGLENNLIDTDMNKQVLDKIIESGHCIACHTANHYEWEKRGYSPYKHLKNQDILK